ncbi:hypothetical protein PR202_ga02666 [Eleusine coracana subsp. coracana]|uniref:RNA helicase n=1 Tax=Eleusine coracana subsp. coracana TaxID=191504 RepID=A0AAV5BKE3_ELECO|nr:hypothetical protein PR202_ga02666 [Eleusine coracana subsp. coracana]
MEDSNALILPCKRKNKEKGKGKDAKKLKIKEDPKMSKTKLKKLQKLEEEKRKKLLQAESIEIFQKHKIPDDAYSLLRASGTIGQYASHLLKEFGTLQAETLKEKQRRAVQFSKAGLDVPEELSLFKRNDNQKVSENIVVAEQISPDKFVESAKCEDHGISYKNNTMEDSVKDMECQPVRVAVVSIPEPKTEEPCDDALVVATQKIQSSTPSCSGAELDMQFLYEAGFGTSDRADRKGKIGITQPRRVAVLATAKRVSYELGLKLGREVGFQSDFLLKDYSVIILDEAHERSLNTDILIGMLSRIIKLRKLKDFISNRRLFEAIPPAVKVPVRQYPVTVHFSKRTHDDYLGQAYKKVMSIHKRLPPGGILVFVTGQREVDYLCQKLRRASKERTAKKPEKIDCDSNGQCPEAEEKEIFEAYDIDRNKSEQQDDIVRWDTESDDEDSVTLETTEEDAPVLEFLKDIGSSAVLKASFGALSGALGVQESVEKSGDATSEEKSGPSESCFSQRTEQKPVSHGRLRVLPLYAMLPASQQLQVFKDIPEGERLVVVATNVAETSLTIPGIKYVVDTGKQKVKNYDPATGMSSYEIQWISKASASQRAGRAGRTGPGHCYRLYSAAAYGKNDLFPEFAEPEIKKTPVEGIVLMLKFMAIDKVANFPFPTPPDKESLIEAERCLRTLEALDSHDSLTPMGKAMAQYPMSPRHSRLLLTVIKILKSQSGFARSNFVLGYAAAAASALSFTNPFLKQLDECDANGESKENNSDPEVNGLE